MRKTKRTGLTAAGTVLAGGLIVGGAAVAVATTQGSGAMTAAGSYGAQGGYGDNDHRGRDGNHTPVTGAELTKVTDAVKAKDAAVTVTGVQKDADGSYDVFGTKSGAHVRYEVSADLATITEGQAKGMGRGGKGGHNHTPVTGAELTKVTDAVKAKDSAVTVTSVQKDADGSYDVFGTKSGAHVRYEVSADLATITEGQGKGMGRGGKGGHNHTPVTGTELAKVTDAVKAKDVAVTVTQVRMDRDGSYDVQGTKAGAKVFFEVSKDLKTITQRN